ncbi:hypothetical protein [Absidia glauca]|uniref:Uncharacterized protein n=1 Tax=Absidia glauca TaxID=4829 RepID=A0A168RIF3_ABSGL|nr:hypothetical protein [Absidia glauca]
MSGLLCDAHEQDSLSLVNSSCLAAIPVPTCLNDLYLINDKSKGRLIAQDRNPLVLIPESTSRISGNAQDENPTVASSLSLSDRPWRAWKQHLSQVLSTNKRRISTVAHNWFVKNAANVAIDTLETVLWKAHDWHYSPSLECTASSSRSTNTASSSRSTSTASSSRSTNTASSSRSTNTASSSRSTNTASSSRSTNTASSTSSTCAASNRQVTVDAAEAFKKYNVGLTYTTITPPPLLPGLVGLLIVLYLIIILGLLIVLYLIIILNWLYPLPILNVPESKPPKRNRRNRNHRNRNHRNRR